VGLDGVLVPAAGRALTARPAELVPSAPFAELRVWVGAGRSSHPSRRSTVRQRTSAHPLGEDGHGRDSTPNTDRRARRAQEHGGLYRCYRPFCLNRC